MSAGRPPPSSRSFPAANTGIDGTDASTSSSSSSSSDASTASSYHDPSTNDLSIISAAALIMADCLGTGILALPADMHVLGLGFGIAFLLFNLPINLYAGTILGKTARFVEGKLDECTAVPTEVPEDDGADLDGASHVTASSEEGDDLGSTDRTSKKPGYASVDNVTSADEPQNDRDQEHRRHKDDVHRSHHANNHVHTSDFLGLTTAIFYDPSTSPDEGRTRSLWPTRLVTTIYYINIFLVLGNYILVMSHAVAALVGEENICLPTAGIVASVLMYGLSQARTMANLGRSASVISLAALFVVVGMCLASIERGDEGLNEEGDDRRGLEQQTAVHRWLDDEQVDGENVNEDATNGGEGSSSGASIPRQLAAIASIGFAVGSQKLLLNIRHEMKVRDNCAPKALGVALFIYGAVYAAVCILAGPNPPSLLFDAIDEGRARQFAGFLLWVHVAVSYAINSQALTSSIDRIGFHRVTFFGLSSSDRRRWAVLTFLISTSSYVVANAVPFFKDLVALIGAMTSVPLTLLLPAILYRRICKVPALVVRNRYDLASYLLVIFSLVFLLCGLFGALDSIELDWEKHGKPFSCY